MLLALEIVTKLEPGLVLALTIYNFKLFKNYRGNGFISAFVMFIVGLLALHLKQIAGIRIGSLDLSIYEVALIANSLIVFWLFCFTAFCKTLFNTKLNNEGLDKNLKALLGVIAFLFVISLIPTVGYRFKDTTTFIMFCIAMLCCFSIGSLYRETRTKTSSKYTMSCLIASASFIPLFLFDVYAVTSIESSFIYRFVVYLSPFVYTIFFYIFELAMLENAKFIREKNIRLQKKKEEAMRKQAEERHFKEVEEQAHKMKLMEQEKEAEASLLSRMAERGKAIQKIADKASAESESKSGYIAFLSHEVRTPLNGIMGMVRMLANTDLDSKQQEFVNNLNYSGESLLALLNDVLDFSKLSSGHMELESIDFNLKQFLDNIVVTMNSRAEQQGIELKGAFDSELPAFIKGDPTRLRQVMLNLIGNSIKFTKEGGVYVSLKSVKKAGNKCKIRAEVRDTGIGIPESAKGKLFQEFVQADSSTTRNFGGTGLGLSICKKLIDAMGGEIGVISQEGSGSTFWWEVEFEVAQKAEEKKEQRDFIANQKDRSCEVLVVEDDQISQQVVGSYLSSNGQLPKFASDGASAIRAVDAGNVDFVFLDMGLPDMNGMEVCKHIRKMKGEARNMPVVALTGNVSEADQKAYMEKGVNFCLGKPVSPEDIQQALYEIFKLLPDDVGKSRKEDGDGDGDDDGNGGGKSASPKKEVVEEKTEEKPVEEKKEESPKPAPVEEAKKEEAPKDEKASVADSSNEDIATMKINEEKSIDEVKSPGNTIRNVLIVEDDIMSQKIIGGYLGNDSYETLVAGSGEEAIKVVEEKDVDLILMDINMPGMNGLEASRQIRAMEDPKKANVPIIAITGNVSEEDITNCRDAGMNDFIGKPVDPDYLRGAIMRIENAGHSSSELKYESVHRYLEENQIPVPKRKNPINVEVPAALKGDDRAEGMPYVLVIEDDRISQKIVAEFLVSFKYNPIVVDNAEEGIELLKKNNFLAVLMDIDLPGMSGLEATKTIRSLGSKVKADIPIIAITGNIKQKDVEDCRAAGMNDFIGKPINPNYLKGALERNQGSVEPVNIEGSELEKHLDTEVLDNLKKSFKPEIFQGLIAQFATSAADAQRELLNAVEKDDRDRIKSQAHLLKGMSRNIGLKIVGNFMEALEKDSDKQPISDLKALAIEAHDVLEEGKAALNDWFDKWKKSDK